MPDPKTSDEHPTGALEGSIDESFVAEGLPVRPDEAVEESALDDEDRAEVAAFREQLGAEEVRSNLSPVFQNTVDRKSSEQHRSEISPPGPGIPEAIAWTIGVLLVHLVGSLVAGLVIVVGQVMRIAAAGTAPSPEVVQEVLTGLPRLLDTYLFELIAVEMAVFLVAAVFTTWLRLGAKTPYRLGIRPLALQHFLLIVAVSIPISLMCGGLHQLTASAWEQWFAHLPGMNLFNNMNVNESIKPLGESAPIGLLLLVIAVAPAIGEELIFRGIIGRGLVARHGVVAGVIMTSLMFAAVHVHPAHVVALLPLAFFIHLVYMATRSILAPMLLHLLNNSLAVVMLKASATIPALEGSAEPDMPAYVLLISAGIVGMVGWTLWRSRIQYRMEDGELWNPGYSTIEIPPESVRASVSFAGCPIELYRGAIGLAGAYSLVFIVSLGLMLSGQIPT